MSKIVVITKEQHRAIYGKEFTTDMIFNPFLDKDGNICLSEEEYNQLNVQLYPDIKALTLKEHYEVLKPENWTKDQWIAYEIAEAEKRKLELEKLKTTEIKK